MAVDAFLKLGDIKGESAVKGKEDQIDVLAWSWGLSQSGTLHMGHGGGAGKVNVQDLSFTKYVDAATPNLFKACCDGKHFDEAVLTFRKAGGSPLEYLVLTLTEVMVTAVSTGGSSGEDRFTENVTLNFAQFKLSYQPQDAKGAKKGGAIEAEYNIAENA
jgi:type VI secretion system secreted protein Hcp